MERAQRELDVAGTFSSIDKVMASETIDTVDIVLPHHLHHPVVVQAAEAGKHCMVEKPIALDILEADEMLEAVRLPL